MFKVSSKKLEEDEGIVYLLAIDLEDKTLVKIGVTARSKVEERICEILTSIWKKYRIFPQCYPKRFRKTTDIFTKEAILHKYFEKYKYKTEHKFGGSTEFFDIPLDDAVKAYETVISGEELDGDYYEPNCESE